MTYLGDFFLLAKLPMLKVSRYQYFSSKTVTFVWSVDTVNICSWLLRNHCRSRLDLVRKVYTWDPEKGFGPTPKNSILKIRWNRYVVYFQSCWSKSVSFVWLVNTVNFCSWVRRNHCSWTLGLVRKAYTWDPQERILCNPKKFYFENTLKSSRGLFAKLLSCW